MPKVCCKGRETNEHLVWLGCCRLTAWLQSTRPGYSQVTLYVVLRKFRTNRRIFNNKFHSDVHTHVLHHVNLFACVFWTHLQVDYEYIIGIHQHCACPSFYAGLWSLWCFKCRTAVERRGALTNLKFMYNNDQHAFFQCETIVVCSKLCHTKRLEVANRWQRQRALSEK